MKIYALAAVAAAIAIAAIFHPPSAPAIGEAKGTPAPGILRRAHSSPPTVVVYVAGAVLHPGLYHLAPGARAVDAVKAAGGLLRSADPAGVNLAELLQDGEEIVAPVTGQVVRRTRSGAAKSGARRRKIRKAARGVPAPAQQIDLNTADAAALQTLPGIGAEMARRLVAFREANGRFASLDELADVAGMTPRRIEQVSPYLYAGR